MNITGIVVKVIGGIYSVLKDNQIYICSVRTSVKKNRILVGDIVKIEPNQYDEGKFIIIDVMSRKNIIPRPPITNIDKLAIVIAPKPEPDLLLVDKLIIYCKLNNIEPILIVNKLDIADENFLNEIRDQYKYYKVFLLSAKDGQGISEFKDYIANSFCVVCGQSAVGKSSLLNNIIPTLKLQTQGLSSKVDRGKHTTRINEIYFYNEIMIADTPGFSSLELDLDYRDLVCYYPEFEQFIGSCKYLDCSHIKEGSDCKIISALNEGIINSSRYQRYCSLYDKLKTQWENKYD